MSLSEEQKRRIEANRIKALEIRKQRTCTPNFADNTSNHASTRPLATAHSYNLQKSDVVSNVSISNSVVANNDSSISFYTVKSNSAPVLKIQHPSLHSRNLNNTPNDHLTIQQKIEQNRKRALALRAAKHLDKYNGNDSNVKKHGDSFIQPTEKTIETAPKDQTNCSSSYNGPVHAATCCLLSSSRFSVATKFHSQLIAVIKQMPSRQYDSRTCRWSLHCDDHDLFIESCTFLQPQVKVEPLPKFIISCLKDSKRTPQKISSSNPLLNKLMPFQKEGVEFALSLNGRALIADDMGLGKTIQALCLMQEYRSEWPLLIICPSSLRLTWSEAVTSWLDDISYSDINVLFKGTDTIGLDKVTIVSYDLLSKFDMIKRFKCVIADESHFIKNAKTARCKATVSILQDTKRCVLLSGTPALSRPIELYTQLQCVNRKKIPPYREFGLRYCNGMKTNWGWDFNGNSNLDELNIFMSANFMVRRLKKDVLDQLPAKRRKKIIIETKLSKSLDTAASGARNASKANYQACFFEYYSETASAKLPGVLSYISELLESGKKFLVFAHHRSMICGVQEHLHKEGVKFILIDGNTAAERRQELCDRYQSDEGCMIALLSLTAANTGFTLTAAHTVVFAELFYNPGILQQAEDRVHRIGQQNSVVIHYLVARKTSDDTMWPMIESKLSVLGDMGVGAGDFRAAEPSNYCIPGDKVDPIQTDIMKFFTSTVNKKPDEEDRNLDDLPSSKKPKIS